MSPQIITKVKIGQNFTVENVKLVFVSVISDSRCPKDVKCVWPGEAEVILKLKKDQNTEEKSVIIGANPPTDYGNLVAESTNKRIFLRSLEPYPKTSKKIPTHDDYYLELIVQDKE